MEGRGGGDETMSRESSPVVTATSAGDREVNRLDYTLRGELVSDLNIRRNDSRPKYAELSFCKVC